MYYSRPSSVAFICSGLGGAAKWKGGIQDHLATLTNATARGRDLAALVYGATAAVNTTPAVAAAAAARAGGSSSDEDDDNEELFVLRRPGDGSAAAADASGFGRQGLVKERKTSGNTIPDNPDGLDSSLPSATAAAAAGGGLGGLGLATAAAAVAGGLASRVAALAEKWSQVGVVEALRNRFVTGDWAAGAERAAARPGRFGGCWLGFRRGSGKCGQEKQRSVMHFWNQEKQGAGDKAGCNHQHKLRSCPES